MLGSPPKRRRQSLSLSITTRSAPGTSSPGANRRGRRAARRPASAARSPTSGRPGASPARPAPVSAYVVVQYAPRSAKTSVSCFQSRYSGKRRRHLAAVLDVVDRDQALGLGIGQRPQQGGVDHAEDRRRGADAEREHQHDGQGEARGLPQPAQPVADVLQQTRSWPRSSCAGGACGCRDRAASAPPCRDRRTGRGPPRGRRRAGGRRRGSRAPASRGGSAARRRCPPRRPVPRSAGSGASGAARAPAGLPQTTDGSASSTHMTARAKRIHAEASACRCCRPSRVIA